MYNIGKMFKVILCDKKCKIKVAYHINRQEFVELIGFDEGGK